MTAGGYFHSLTSTFLVNKKQALIASLSDGKFHSGEALAADLGVSRTAVWKQMRGFAGYGLDVFRVRGRGYCLSTPLELFDDAAILSAVDAADRRAITGLEVFFSTDSTNGQLLQRVGRRGFHGSVAVAEFQSAGRGRRGRHWLSPLGAGICMSLAWRFDPQPETLTALPLAAGVAVMRALRELGLSEASLKWPNDIICNGSKLGGILLESRSEMAGPCDVVLGIGVNYRLPDSLAAALDQPVTDICRQLQSAPGRNLLCGRIISHALRMFREFARHGFAPFIEQWRRYDGFAGKQARLLLQDRSYTGKVLGVTDTGMLQMSIRGNTRQFANGELSLRMVS